MRFAAVFVLAALAVLPPEVQKPTPVWLHVTVTDKEGHLVLGLAQGQFTVEQGGREVPIAEFVKDEHPVAISLMLDISGSMGAVLQEVARAAEALVARFIRGDRVNIGTFATAITYSSRFTANKRIIQEGIRDAMMGGEMICKLPSATGSSARPGGTWMWDAVECGVRVVSSDGEAFRRILLLVTDGMINGGYATESSALHRATDAGVLVYATGLRGVMGLDSPLLTGFTRATGGWYVTLKKGEDFTPIFKRIGEELHNQYVMSFLSTDAAQPVQVRVKDPELKVRTQRGRNITPKVP